jgi:hypothetical protein
MNKLVHGIHEKHLEKEDVYRQQILALIVEVETGRKQVCGRIKDVISSNIPYKPFISFQKIITDKLKFSCRKLRKNSNSES